MNFEKSAATSVDISIYTTGSCHEFAEAVNRYTGWPILVVFDKAIPSITNDKDETLHALMHVACMDPDGGVWDVTGRVDRKDAARHFRKYMSFGRVGFDLLETYDEVSRYIGFGDYQNLAHQYDTTREWADRDARRVLREFGILPSPEEFTDREPDGSVDFENDYAFGLPSLNLATAIGTHFGYPVAVAFGSDKKVIRAWAEDSQGRPITSSGPIGDHSELALTTDCSIRVWDTAYHAIADGRLRHLLGGPGLARQSLREALDAAKAAFPSIRDKPFSGCGLTEQFLVGTVAGMEEDIRYAYDHPEDLDEIRRMAKNGRPHRVAMDAVLASVISSPTP
ncbi:hypothetical protein G6L37_02515 [Agrobacterium rubi]|nr:hypothetical protein [Agrobacterium rubi]NTF24269.1 hypothetical protein [Agrobacterium rubi]